MRVMVLVKGSPESEAGQLPPEELFEEMGAYNEQLGKAGVLLAAEGLQPSSAGKRVRFGGPGEADVIDGPFAETKELIAGYWLWEVPSLEEAVEWIKRRRSRRPRSSCDRCTNWRTSRQRPSRADRSRADAA